MAIANLNFIQDYKSISWQSSKDYVSDPSPLI